MHLNADEDNIKETIEQLKMLDGGDRRRMLAQSNVLGMDQVTNMGCEYTSRAFDLIECMEKDCDQKGLLDENFYVYRDCVLDICINMRIAMNHRPPPLLIEELWNALEIEMRSYRKYCNDRFEASLEKKGKQFLEKALFQNKSKFLQKLLAEDFKMADRPISIDEVTNGDTDKQKLIKYLKSRHSAPSIGLEIVDLAVNVETNTALYLYEAGGVKGTRSECIILHFNVRHNIVEQVYSDVTGNLSAQDVLDEYLKCPKIRKNEGIRD